MKPLNKRMVLPKKIKAHIRRTSEEKLIPDKKWQSLKAVKDTK
jgi:hypothetical protein